MPRLRVADKKINKMIKIRGSLIEKAKELAIKHNITQYSIYEDGLKKQIEYLESKEAEKENNF